MKNGKDTVLQTFDTYSAKKVHWKLYYGSEAVPSNLRGSTQDYVGELDKTTSRKLLEDILDCLEPGRYMIQFKDSATASSSFITLRFEIAHEYGRAPAVIQGQLPAGYISPQMHRELLEAERGRIKAESDLERLMDRFEDLEQDIKELKRGGSGKQGAKEIVEAITQGINGFMALANGQQVQLTPGGASITGPKAGLDYHGLMEDTLDELQEYEGGGQAGMEKAILLLACINEYRKENKVAFEAFKPTVLAYAKNLDE